MWFQPVYLYRPPLLPLRVFPAPNALVSPRAARLSAAPQARLRWAHAENIENAVLSDPPLLLINSGSYRSRLLPFIPTTLFLAEALMALSLQTTQNQCETMSTALRLFWHDFTVISSQYCTQPPRSPRQHNLSKKTKTAVIGYPHWDCTENKSGGGEVGGGQGINLPQRRREKAALRKSEEWWRNERLCPVFSSRKVSFCTKHTDVLGKTEVSLFV